MLPTCQLSAAGYSIPPKEVYNAITMTPTTTPVPAIQARHHKSKRNSTAGNPSFYPDGRLVPSTDLVDVARGNPEKYKKEVIV